MLVITCDLDDNDQNVLNQFKKAIICSEKILSMKESFILDMTNLTWITAVSVVILSHALKKSKAHCVVNLPENPNVYNYLSVVGFPNGSERNVNSSYVPLRYISGDVSNHVNKVYDLISRQLPKTASGNLLGFILSELGDNISDHSKYNSGIIFAQHFKNKGFIDIIFLDDGISIPKSFENSNILIKHDADAIFKALNGVSTKKDKERGTGLNNTEKIITDALNGELCVFSRKGALVTGQLNERNLYIFEDISFSGTIVHCRFKVPAENINIYKYINKGVIEK